MTCIGVERRIPFPGARAGCIIRLAGTANEPPVVPADGPGHPNMNPLVKIQPPANEIATPGLQPPTARAWEKQRSRETENRLKLATLHRPTIIRSQPHARGR